MYPPRIVAVTGSRTWWDGTMLGEILRPWLSFPLSELHVGDARGADRLAAERAKLWNVPVTIYKADWDGKGKAAGMIRNREMLEKGKPEVLIAFKLGEKSAGTDGCCIIAQQLHIPIVMVNYLGWGTY